MLIVHGYLQRYTFNIRLQDSSNRCYQCVCNIQRYVASTRMFANVWLMQCVADQPQCQYRNICKYYDNLYHDYARGFRLPSTFFNQLVLQDVRDVRVCSYTCDILRQ